MTKVSHLIDIGQHTNPNLYHIVGEQIQLRRDWWIFMVDEFPIQYNALVRRLKKLI